MTGLGLRAAPAGSMANMVAAQAHRWQVPGAPCPADSSMSFGKLPAAPITADAAPGALQSWRCYSPRNTTIGSTREAR